MIAKPFRFVLIGLAAAILAGCGAQAGSSDSKVATPASADQVARGKYLARAADCAACHTSEDGGAPFAGGVALDTPFGKLYGTNITPDKEHGIGNWSADDFYKALHDGVTPDKRLYPAMPYTSYRSLSREDTDALYAYLMSVKPAKVPNKEDELHFPFNLRFGVVFWNMLFLKDSLPDASAGQSASWQRGRYLAGALGHCAECHTPRGKLGQLDLDKPLAGGVLGRIGAPDITPAGLAARGWTAKDLETFFATGVAPQGSAYGEMYPVIHLSSQHLSKTDLTAMATYLMGDKAPAPAPLKEVKADAAELTAGRQLYTAVCAGCHGREGEGKPNVTVAMKGNATVRNADPRNLIVASLDGIKEQRFPNNGAMQEMPGFAGKLSDKEMAQLANFLRASWGGQSADVTADAVKALR